MAVSTIVPRIASATWIDLNIFESSAALARPLPDGVSLLVPDNDSDTPGHPGPYCSESYNVVVNPLNGILYASCFAANVRDISGVLAINGSSIRALITDDQCPGARDLAISASQNYLTVVCNNNQMLFLNLQTSKLIATAPKLSPQTCYYPHNPIFDERAPIVYVACTQALNGGPSVGTILRLDLLNDSIDVIASPTQCPNAEFLSLDPQRDILYVGGYKYGGVRSGLLAIHLQGKNITHRTMLLPDTECDRAFVQTHPISGALYFECLGGGTLKEKGMFVWNYTLNNYTVAYPSCTGRKIWDIVNGRMYARCGLSNLAFVTEDNQILPILPANIPISSFCKDIYPSSGTNVNVWDVNPRNEMVYLSCYAGPGVVAINVTTVMKNTFPPSTTTTTPAPGGSTVGPGPGPGPTSSSLSNLLSFSSMSFMIVFFHVQFNLMMFH